MKCKKLTIVALAIISFALVGCKAVSEFHNATVEFADAKVSLSINLPKNVEIVKEENNPSQQKAAFLQNGKQIGEVVCVINEKELDEQAIADEYKKIIKSEDTNWNLITHGENKMTNVTIATFKGANKDIGILAYNQEKKICWGIKMSVDTFSPDEVNMLDGSIALSFTDK